MCMSISSSLRVHPWHSSHQGWASWPASSFILTLATGRGQSATGVRDRSPSSPPPAHTLAALSWPLSSWHRKAEAKNLGLKAQIPTVDKNTVTDHYNLMKKENGIRNTFLMANVWRCGVYYKALRAAAASSLTPHTCTELWFLIPGINNPIQVAVVTEITVHTPITS